MEKNDTSSHQVHNKVGCSVLVGGGIADQPPPAGYEHRLAQALDITRQSLQCTGVAGLLGKEEEQEVDGNRKTFEGGSGSSTRPACSNVALCFNAGKDSIVTLELMVQVAGVEALKDIVLFMFEEEDEFPELVTYRSDYLRHFENRGLDLVVVPKMDWAKGLTFLKDKYHLDGVILGTRSTDPDGKWQSGAIAPTTGKFPPMVRYCPVFHWTLPDVWYYLASRQLPICSLYREGYTSLGCQLTTRPNPHLLEMNMDSSSSSSSSSSSPLGSSVSKEVVGVAGETKGSSLQYRPAWEMQDCLLERAGRGKKPSIEN